MCRCHKIIALLFFTIFATSGLADESSPKLKTFVSVDEFAKLQSELAKKSVEVQLVQQELAKKTAQSQIHEISGTRPLEDYNSHPSGITLTSIVGFKGQYQATLMFHGQPFTVNTGDKVNGWSVTAMTATEVILTHGTDNTQQILKV